MSKNNSPPFGTNQYHEGLKDIFDSTNDSQLCFPSALTTALVKQFAYQPSPVRGLPLKGLSPDKESIDLNESVRDLFELCGTNKDTGTGFSDGANCIKSFYDEASLPNAKVTMIRQTPAPIPTPGVEVRVQKIQLSDITNAVDQGEDIILFLKWGKPSLEDNKWADDGGHFVNVFGYSRQIPWADLIILHVSNPGRQFPLESDRPAFDSILVQKKSQKDLSLGRDFSDLVLEGFLFQGLKYRAFIGGLITFKPI